MRVALVGMGNLVHEPVPWDELDVEIWGLASRPKVVARYRRLDLGFEVHDPSIWAGVGHTYAEHIAQINALGCPVVTLKNIAGFERGRVFPMTEAVEIGADLFVSSFDYMVAHAIVHGAKWIGCYGFPMAQDDFEKQRHGAHYWLGLAQGLGIEIEIPPRSTLLSAPYRYGGTDDPRCGAPPRNPARTVGISFAPRVVSV